MSPSKEHPISSTQSLHRAAHQYVVKFFGDISGDHFGAYIVLGGLLTVAAAVLAVSNAAREADEWK